MFDVPETIIEIVVVLHSDSFVFRLDVLCAHGGFANSQRVSFTLGKYGHNGPLLTGSHPGIGMGQTCGGALVSHTGTGGRGLPETAPGAHSQDTPLCQAAPR